MVLLLRAESMEFDPTMAAWDKFVERFSESITKLTDQFAEDMKQARLKSDPRHDRKVLICGFTEEEDCLCEATDSLNSVYQDNNDEDDVDLHFKEEESHQRQLQIRQEDDRAIPEVGDHEDLLAKIEDPSSLITQVCAESIHDKVIYVPTSDFSSLSLANNFAVGEVCTNEKEFPVANKVFDKSPERREYIARLNPDPPDDSGDIIHDGKMELKLNPVNVMPIDNTKKLFRGNTDKEIDKERAGVLVGTGMGGLIVFSDGVQALLERGHKKKTLLRI